MTRNEMLLNTLSEECAEVIQRVSKALRFGLHETERAQPYTNSQRIVYEYLDILAIFKMLERDGLVMLPPNAVQLMNEKIERVDQWLAYSKEMGTLT